MTLAGKVVVVPLEVDAAELARALGAAGATVVVVAGPAAGERAGAVAADLEAGPGRPAVFTVASGDELGPVADYLGELLG